MDASDFSPALKYHFWLQILFLSLGLSHSNSQNMKYIMAGWSQVSNMF